MDQFWTRVGEHFFARVTGPMKFRLVMQPAMAIFFAIRDGLKDAREGKPPYFWGLFTHPGERKAMLKSGWMSVGKVFILAMVLDAIYQFIELRRIYPGQHILVALILAIVPYLLLRGPINRVAQRRHEVAKERWIGD